jgi:hypothetical protein
VLDRAGGRAQCSQPPNTCGGEQRPFAQHLELVDKQRLVVHRDERRLRRRLASSSSLPHTDDKLTLSKKAGNPMGEEARGVVRFEADESVEIFTCKARRVS